MFNPAAMAELSAIFAFPSGDVSSSNGDLLSRSNVPLAGTLLVSSIGNARASELAAGAGAPDAAPDDASAPVAELEGSASISVAPSTKHSLSDGSPYLCEMCLGRASKAGLHVKENSVPSAKC